jgi:hypothetical protein
MNDAEKTKLYTAVRTIVNMESELRNMIGRSARAAKFWDDTAKSSKGMDANQKKKLRDAAASIVKLTRDAKVVLKDLDSALKDSRDAKVLATCATGKEFRDKVLVKRLASARKFDTDAMSTMNAITTVLGGGDGLWPGMNEVDPKVTINSIKQFSSYFTAMRLGLAKL